MLISTQRLQRTRRTVTPFSRFLSLLRYGVTNLKMNEQDVIELLSDSDDDDDVVVVPNPNVAPAINNAPNIAALPLLDANATRTVVIIGPPKAMPRATFMAWMNNNQLVRRVMNQARPFISAFRQRFVDELIDNHDINPMVDLPLYREGGVHLEVKFYRRLPNTVFQGRQHGANFVGQRYGTESNWPDTKKPDIDNLLKFVMDALIGVLYNDDDQVVKTIFHKLVDNHPPFQGRTEVTFRQVHRQRDFPVNAAPNAII